ncbi:MAG TPA: hypothetical protein PKW95_07660 [bacterium]|nr:hypothetical protein [bacterium]
MTSADGNLFLIMGTICVFGAAFVVFVFYLLFRWKIITKIAIGTMMPVVVVAYCPPFSKTELGGF